MEILERKIETLPVIPLRNIVTFPQMVTHFDVGREKSIKAIEEAEFKDSRILLLAQKDAQVVDPAIEDIYSTGTIAEIRQVLKLPHGQLRVLVEGDKKARVSSFQENDDYLAATVEVYEKDQSDLTTEEAALFRLIKQDLEEYVKNNSAINAAAISMVNEFENPDDLIDMVASYMPIEIEQSQKLLEIDDRKERMLSFHEVLQKELELQNIENKISQRVKKQMGDVQKEYYLREQLRAIQEELGEGSEGSDQDSYVEKIKALGMPEESEEKVLKEADKLGKINPNSAEYSVILNYLDTIIDLPWTIEEDDKEVIDLEKSQKILDEDHYGLKDVKERIIEFLAVRQLSDTNKGPILCLVGPPGVGKTSVARSVARSLDKEFVRMSLGGVRDEAEIRGHRRTYVGAMPGSIISNISKAGTMNPVFLLDEIDKLGSDFRGDPASAMLEVLDPEQNSTFTDHYLDLPYDLSNVLFLTTANDLSTIPRPLLDRMEVISIEGYTPFEKLEIAKRHILPKILKETNIEKDALTISDNAMMTVINNYTRESGVRGLERQIQKIIRKAAVQVVRDGKNRIRITDGNIQNYLGPKRFTFDELDKDNQVGMVNGLAWTQVGGTTLRVEANVTKGKGKIQLTGQLGDVMKESAQAAITYIRSVAKDYGLEEDFMEKTDIHIHVPEGATPKDGPSAGITMATAILSALTQKQVRNDIAMTGEITLSGRVLPIGGLKEKLMAATRMGITTVVIPKDNEKDLVEIEDNIKAPLEIIPVSKVGQVFEEAIVN